MKFSYYRNITPTDQTLIVSLIPKNGCTTLANMCIQIHDIIMPADELNQRSKYFLTHTNEHIIYNSTQWYKEQNADIKIAVKRDPVKRFLSFYKNRILFHNDFGKRISVDELQQNFSYYEQQLPFIRHALTQTHYGGLPEYYTHIFSMGEFDVIAELLSDLFDKKIIARHLQQGGNDIDITLTPAQLNWIYDYYKIDYENGWCE